ncbi:hypothetical protein ABZ948_40745, partial [Streptomyces olindensis]
MEQSGTSTLLQGAVRDLASGVVSAPESGDSPRRPTPRAETMSAERMKPVRRETIVPAAITA